MRATASTVLTSPIESVDLERWMFTLSDDEYRAAARGHHGAGTTVVDGVRGTINVESVGGHLIVQHYREVEAGPRRTDLVSPRSRAYLLQLVPVGVRVRWLLEVTEVPDGTQLTCTVELEMPPVLTLLARSVLLPWFLQRHVDEEILGFAQDMERKFAVQAAPK